jgi:hypothetical protein
MPKCILLEVHMPTTSPGPDPSLRLVLSIDFTTARAVSPAHPEGDRILLAVTGGAFRGDGPHGPFDGTVTHGSDWVTRHPDGLLTLDVRAQLLASDGTVVLMTYRGISAEGAVHTAPIFSAPTSSSFDWLNRLVCLARGEVRDGGVSYDVFTMA